MQAGSYGGIKLGKEGQNRRVNWLLSIQQWQEEFLGNLPAESFVNIIKEDLLGTSVCVFTRSGDLMRLPKVGDIS